MDYINNAGEYLVCGVFIGMAAACGTIEWLIDSGPLTIERLITLIGWAI